MDLKNQRITLTTLGSGQNGSIWSEHPVTSKSWKVELSYTAYKGTDALIADGIALWYAPPISKSTFRGQHEIYGGPSTSFTGLMIAVDVYYQPSSYTLSRTNDQSAIIVVNNDYARKYDWDTEGHNIVSGRCLVRNQERRDPNKIETLTVEYANESLKVYHTNEEASPCVVLNSLKLPAGYHFGISASTGGTQGAFQLRSFKLYESRAKLDLSQYSLQEVLQAVSELMNREAKKAQQGSSDDSSAIDIDNGSDEKI